MHGRLLLIAWLLLSVMICSGGSPLAAGTCRKLRFTTFNTSLNRNRDGELLRELASNSSSQARNISAILQHIRPDVLLLNEFDYVAGGAAVDVFQELYLGVPQAPGLEPLRFDYVFVASVNTGVPSGRDFDHDGKSEGPGDCFGYGMHPGQYGMVLLSRFPIAGEAARTFQHFLWRDMPGALLPSDPDTGRPWYSKGDLEVFRLPSKSLWDVPIDIPCEQNPQQQTEESNDIAGQQTIQQPAAAPAAVTGASSDNSRRVHMLLHHPTPPVFDGRERRNMLRNHDEIRLMADYIGCSGGGSNAYIYDDNGARGGLESGAPFVVMGDHNADPRDGESCSHAIRQLLGCSSLINTGFVPTSDGGREAGNRRSTDRTPPETKTSSFDLRVDYVLPSKELAVVDGGVWWPVRADPLSQLLEASDHRPVYLDVEIPPWAAVVTAAAAAETAAAAVAQRERAQTTAGQQRGPAGGGGGAGLALV